MADPRLDAYANWLVQNQEKRGTPEFETVATAYKGLRGSAAPNQQAQRAKQFGLEQDSEGRLGGDSLSGGHALNFLQGASFNFADEILPYTNSALDEAYGAVTGQDAGNFDENVEYYRNQAREIGNRMWAERPTETVLTQIGGGLASGGLGLSRAATGTIGKVAPGTAAALRAGTAGLGARAAQGGVAGAMGGALAGAGAGTDIQSRAEGAAMGAAVGAPLGAAIPFVTPALGATGRFLQSTFAPGTVNAERRAAEVLGEAVSRSPSPTTPTSQLATLQGQGIGNAAIADLSDELTAVTGAVSRAPGQGRQIVGDFLRARQEGNPAAGQAGGGQWADIFDDISSAVSPSVSAKRAGEAVIAARAKEAQPLYEKALSAGPVNSAELSEIAQTPGVKGLLMRAVDMAKQRRELPLNFKLDTDGPVPVSVWHQAKQALDDAISARLRAGHKYGAGSLLDVQHRLLAALDDVTDGGYGIARNAFAGKSALLNALERGKNILQRSTAPEDIADELAKLTSKSEQEFFRAGAAQAMRDTVGRVGRKGNAAAKFLNRPDIQQKLRAMFGNDAEYKSFVERMMGRDRLYRTYSELGNSQTASRLASADDLDQAIVSGAEPESIISAAAGGGRQGIVRALYQRLQDGSTRFLSEKVRTRLAEMLTSGDPAKIKRVAQLIEEAAKRAKAARVRGGKKRIGTVQGVMQTATQFTRPYPEAPQGYPYTIEPEQE